MINGAIFWKTMRDSASLILASTLGTIGFVILFVWAMLSMGTEVLEFVSKFSFLKKIFEVGFGIKVSGDVSINILFAVCFTHAVVLTLSWATMIATTSRVTAGEIERGTADLLLTLPVTRSEVYCSTALVWVLTALLLAVCPVVGVWIGSQIFETKEVIIVTRYFKPALNFFCLLLAIGGISSLVSCLFDRRSVAIATVVGIVLASSVLNFVEPFVEAIKPFRFLGLLNYFRPVDVVRLDQWPIMEMVILCLVGMVCWLLGLVVFCRKDIPTA